MPNKLTWNGIDVFRAELRALPKTLKREASPILLRRATGAEAEVVAAYPYVTGALRAGVRVVAQAAEGLATVFRLESRAPHAHLYEFGSRRQAGRATFHPISELEQRAAVVDVADVVKATGLRVTGEHD